MAYSGPTETVVVADETAHPGFCAADLIAQAEHDPLATAILVTNSPGLVPPRSGEELDLLLANALSWSDGPRSPWNARGKVVLVDTVDEALQLANAIAPRTPLPHGRRPLGPGLARSTTPAGLFLGEFLSRGHGRLHRWAPVHVMPTGGTARFGFRPWRPTSSFAPCPLSALSKESFSQLGSAAVAIAQAEGLSGPLRRHRGQTRLPKGFLMTSVSGPDRPPHLRALKHIPGRRPHGGPRRAGRDRSRGCYSPQRGTKNPYGPSPRGRRSPRQVSSTTTTTPTPAKRRLREALSDYLEVDPRPHRLRQRQRRTHRHAASHVLSDQVDNVLLPTPHLRNVCLQHRGSSAATPSPSPRDDNFEIDLESRPYRRPPPRPRPFFLASAQQSQRKTSATEGSDSGPLLETGVFGSLWTRPYYEFLRANPSLPHGRRLPQPRRPSRTFSKWARLGRLCALGLGRPWTPAVSQTMMSMKPPYKRPPSPAEVGLLASLEDRPTLMSRVQAIVQERGPDDVPSSSKSPGSTLGPPGPTSSFAVYPRGRGKEIFEGLCRRGIFLRYFGNARLQDYIRISVGLPEENGRSYRRLGRPCGSLAMQEDPRCPRPQWGSSPPRRASSVRLGETQNLPFP